MSASEPPAAEVDATRFTVGRDVLLRGTCPVTRPDDPLQPLLPTNASSASATPRSVFVSYARADALDFATRLAADLKQRGGHRAWIDHADIEKGGLFEVRIEQGIRAAE